MERHLTARRRAGDQGVIAKANKFIHDNISVFMVIMPILAYGGGVIGIRWVGSPASLRASIDTVAFKQKQSVDSLHGQLKDISDQTTIMNHKIDVVVVLICTRLTKDQRDLVRTVFTCLP